MTKQNVNKVSVFKIKDSVANFNDFMKAEHLEEIKLGKRISARVYFASRGHKKKNNDDFPWISFFNSKLNNKIKFYQNNIFPSGALSVCLHSHKSKHKNFYVIVFGLAADSFINKDKIVTDFGIKVGMNMCDENKLRHVSTQQHESITTLTQRQTSSESDIDHLNINDEKEFLKVLSGKTLDKYSYISSFRGKENITLKLERSKGSLDWKKLLKIIEDLDELYKSPRYKKIFTQYDKFHIEQDKEKIRELDDILLHKLACKETGLLHLAPPEYVDYDDFVFYYGRATDENGPFNDLDINDFLKTRKKKISTKSSINSLKQTKVITQSESSSAVFPKWSIYSCIVAEVKDKSQQTYILSDSTWKKASSSFIDDINQYIADIISHDPPINLPSNISISDENKQQAREDVYNKHVRDSDCKKYFLFDKSNLKIATESGFEFCDLLSKTKSFIHVKRYRSGSASISHLFVQGKFYAESFLSDNGFRLSIRNFIQESHTSSQKDCVQDFLNIIPTDKHDIDERKYSVVFCILSPKNDFKVSDLPLMSKYELMCTYKHLTEYRNLKCSCVIKSIKVKGD